MAAVVLERPTVHVALLRLNRPEARNALSPELREELREHFLALAQDRDCRAIVLTGDRRAFAAGADIKAMVATGPAEMMARGDEANWAAIRDCPKPIIAAVNGYALGGGCELAMSADIIVAGQGATFGQPEVRLGIMPGAGGTQRLTRAIGKHRAMLMLLTGASLSATEALAAGLVSKVVDDESTVEEALALASRIAAMPPIAVAEIKRVVLAGMDVPLDTAIMLERRAAYLLFGTEDKREAMTAFIEKRSPVFSGT
ncbi:MAG: enoyl-CoA hydratase/isomerase family protein [Mesorhizobium sp.]|nr:enoyl-CoA hydratase-related protein [Mesorhizobium sp.]MBN9245586.1 enoyl-CoA hydratase/isomerase family protein [Mesorhizobium sp.]